MTSETLVLGQQCYKIVACPLHSHVTLNVFQNDPFCLTFNVLVPSRCLLHHHRRLPAASRIPFLQNNYIKTPNIYCYYRIPSSVLLYYPLHQHMLSAPLRTRSSEQIFQYQMSTQFILFFISAYICDHLLQHILTVTSRAPSSILYFYQMISFPLP